MQPEGQMPGGGQAGSQGGEQELLGHFFGDRVVQVRVKLLEVCDTRQWGAPGKNSPHPSKTRDGDDRE